MDEEQVSWLNENRLPRDRWLYSDNAKPIINDLVERGLMCPVHGEFREYATDQTMRIFGRSVPVIDLVSVYTLTDSGRTLLTGASS